MHKDGHIGMSLLLSSPFVAIFLVFELYAFATLFVLLMLSWSSLPDVDIYLQKYDDISYSTYSIRFWHWVPIMKGTAELMTFFGQYIERVPNDFEYKSVTHRGLTHSIWFSIVLGFILSILVALMLLVTLFVDATYETSSYLLLNDIFNASPLYLIPFMFVCGITSVGFHCVGDIFTPTGIHYTTPRTDYGFTLDQFYAKNEVANRSALPFGIILMSYSVFFGFAYGHVNAFYLWGGFIGLLILIIPLWILFVRTGIGKIVYIIYDYLS